MMKSMPSISIRNPVFAWMLMSSLILFGAISFNRIGISQLPDVDFPIITVSASLEGAAPEIMESSVIDVLEGQLTTVEGVKSMESKAKTGSASITLEFDIDRNIDIALQDVQAKVAQAQRRLPKDLDPPTISKTNPEDQPILWIGITSKDMSKREFMRYTRDEIRDHFAIIPGVGDVFMGGYVDPAMRIWIDPSKLSRYAMTVNDVLNTIQQEHAEPPAGRVEQGSEELNIRTLGEAKNQEEFKSLRMNTRGGGANYNPIRMGDVVEIEAGLSDIRRISRVGGIPSIGLGIRKQRGANAVEVASLVKKKMEVLKKGLPAGMEMQVVFDNTQFIREAVHELNFTLVVSAILTSIVIFFFLGSFSSTFNVLLSIPTSIVGTFIVLYFSKFTLNTFTLLGLSLAIGIVVDDAIMVLENITQHREKGKSAKQAALDGANQIYFAALAATISIAAIFLPVAFMKGVIGKYFYQFGITMTAAVLLSLVEAVTLTPMRAAAFGTSGEKKGQIGQAMDRFLARVVAAYSRGLEWALARRWKVLFGAVALFVISLSLSRVLPKELSPAEDQSRFMVRLTAPVGSSLQYTDTKTLEVEKIIQAIPELTTYFVSVGGFGGGDVNTAMIFVSLKPKSQRKRNQEQVMNGLRGELKQVKGIKGFAQDLSMRGFSNGKGYPVEFSVQGPNFEILGDATQKIMGEMEKTGIFVDVDTDYLLGMPEVQIIPNREKASARGVSIQAIGQMVNTLIGGGLVGYYSDDGRRNEVRVKLKEDSRSALEKIDAIFVRNNRGELIPLKDVVKIESKKTLQQISRKDRQRAIAIFSNVAKGKSQEQALKIAEEIARKNLPNGYRFVQTGSSQAFKESFQSLIFALLLGIIVAYMILASQFNSFIDPVSVLIALPFSISGAFLALWIAGSSINLYSMIGFILLMGIVKKNSILLVEFTNQVREEGLDVKPALIKACPSRLRPIIMTSFATIVGALPAALSFGPGSETRSPMAIAVIGGVAVSTFLTLYVVPCFYSLFAKKRRADRHTVSSETVTT